MFLTLLLLFTVLPALELYFLIKVGGVIGVIPTIWIVLLTGVIGAHFARSQGFGIYNKLQTQLRKGEAPANTLIQGLLVLVGGIFLITPGFLTDAVGLSFVFPMTRYFWLKFFSFLIAKSIRSGKLNIVTYGYRSETNENSSPNPMNFNQRRNEKKVNKPPEGLG